MGNEINFAWCDEQEQRAAGAEYVKLPIDDFLALISAYRESVNALIQVRDNHRFSAKGGQSRNGWMTANTIINKAEGR